MSLDDLIAAAWHRRATLHDDADLDAYRLFHGFAEGCVGLDIDRYGAAVLVRYAPDLTGALASIAEVLGALGGFDTIIASPRGDTPHAIRGALPAGPIEIREHGLRFAVDLRQAGNPGLFLDARPTRAWIRANSAGRRVLNLFAFTGSLGVAARVGGASGVTHIDSQRAALDRCRDNHARNGVPVDDRDLMRANVYQHLRRNAAGRQRFAAIIVDPPPQTVRLSDRTPGPRGVLGLAPLVARMLAPAGWMLCLLHEPSGDESDEQAVIAAAGVPLEVIWRGGSGPDFPEPDPRRQLRVIAFARTSPTAPPLRP